MRGREGQSLQNPWVLLACPECSAKLAENGTALICRSCKRRWEVREGIPRFFDPENYWGEVPQAEALSLLSDARRDGWRQAVIKHFENDQAMLYSVVQSQSRASWLPLLGSDKDGLVALDIGSGYGAITQALARAVSEVYSLEAITERLEFTSVRLRQEGLLNVKLVQGSATKLPFPDNAFDLVVVNGVLEWVGEWDTSASPREIQRQFLRKIFRILKPGGVLLIGIENRIGYNNFRGALDHSGLTYTGLMPRWLATLVLRHSHRRSSHRRQLNEKCQYRTYTYSEMGYRKILSESGFRDVSFYAADPGYNKPLSLVSLNRNALAAHTLRMMSEPILGSRPRWSRLIKFYLSRFGVMRYFIPEFVIIANKAGHHDGSNLNAVWQRLKTAGVQNAV